MVIFEDNNLATSVIDGKGAGGAHHHYVTTDKQEHHTRGEERFQSGAIQENGVNGTQNEHLLAIVKHRLQCFQKGKYSCSENAAALKAVDQALQALVSRTTDRKKRGVEGKSVK